MGRQGIRSPRRSAVTNAVATGLSTIAVTGAAAVVAVLLAHKFGRTAKTDGFLAAYAVYLVLALAAQAFRLVIVPDLTRAAASVRLGAEVRAYAVAFAALALPATALTIAFHASLGDAVTGNAESAHLAGRALEWIVPAGFAQVLAALAASALAALDAYVTAAVAYAAGAVASVVIFAALADAHGLISLAWAAAINGGIALALPAVVLAARGGLAGRARDSGVATAARLGRLLRGAAIPVALQGLYLVALRLAAGLGVGNQTSLSYAYIIAATLVAATASSLSLISSAPLTRRGLDAASAAAHVVHAAWVSLALIGAAAGVFALVGGRIAGVVLGNAYHGHVGRDLGGLVVALAPWMVASVTFSLTFPIVFVLERSSLLVPIALGSLALHVPVSLALREAFGLVGLALALALTTFVLIVALLGTVSPRMLALTGAGVARLAVVVGALVVVAFGAPALILPGATAAAAVGLALYAVMLAALRPRGLRDAWHYVRGLHNP